MRRSRTRPVSDAEVDPAVAALLPPVHDNRFSEDDVEYEPFKGDTVMSKADDYTPETLRILSN